MTQVPADKCREKGWEGQRAPAHGGESWVGMKEKGLGQSKAQASDLSRFLEKRKGMGSTYISVDPWSLTTSLAIGPSLVSSSSLGPGSLHL